MIQSNSNSIYHGATLVVKRALGSAFTMQGSYTYGKAIDDTDGGETGQQAGRTPGTSARERGLAGFDCGTG
jgi:hypothetical protein